MDDALFAAPHRRLNRLTGEWVLPYTIGPMHVAKAVVAALFAARYFQLRGYSRIACVAGALSLAFCGHIMSRGTWYEYATEVAVVSFYLFDYRAGSTDDHNGGRILPL